MHFLQVMQSPVLVKLPAFGNRPATILRIPKFTLDEVVAWGAEIEQANVDRVTENMDETRKREYLTLYPPSSPDLNELRRLVVTPPGTREVITRTFAKAKVHKAEGPNEDKVGVEIQPLTPDEIEILIGQNGAGKLSNLAFDLADLVDRSQQMIKKPGEGKKPEEGADPLTKPGSGGSNA